MAPPPIDDVFGAPSAPDCAMSEHAPQDFDAIVVAGGSGTRLGGSQPGDKAQTELGGRWLVEHVLAAVGDANVVVCVGDGLPSPLLGDPVRLVEDPVGSGPLAAVAAALRSVASERVVLAAGDTPFIDRALPALRRELELSGRDAAVLVDDMGRRHYLVAIWRTQSLRSSLERLGDVVGKSMRSLYDLPGLVVGAVIDLDDAAFDVDTIDDLAAAERQLERRQPR